MEDTAGSGGRRRRDSRASRADEPAAAASVPAGPDTCSACRSAALTRLPMVLTDGTDVVFVSCQSCERREWFQPAQDGGWSSIPIDSVLQRVGRRR